jgi:hypothetical protein
VGNELTKGNQSLSSTVSESDRKELQLAKHLLENPGIAAKITSIIGMPVEKGIERLPKNWGDRIGKLTRTALMKASEAAIFTLKDVPSKASSDRWHKLSVAASGGVSGFFGLTALAIELPVSTTIMLRSIAEIARSQGESISDPKTKLACLEVFALGGSKKSDDAAGSGYYAVRALLSKSISEAAEFVVERGLAEKGAPVLVRLIAVISQRFGVQITEKAAAQAIPAIGAAGGALINTIFMDHFQAMAKGHFIVRKLERKYGKEVIKSLYEKL